MSTHPELYEEAVRQEEEEMMHDPFYDDPNPPNWPNNKTSFNRWFHGLHALIYALQHKFSPYRNPKGMRAKYVNLRIDTRNGNFLLFCDGLKEGEHERISPDDLGLTFIPFERDVKLSALSTEEMLKELMIREDVPTTLKEMISLRSWKGSNESS